MKKLVAILLTFLLVLVGCDSVEITKVDDDIKTDAIRFSNEYEKVDKNNVYEYSTYSNVIETIKEKTGIIYLGFPTCTLCKEIVPILNKAAIQKEIGSIQYYNFKEIRDNDTKEYQELASILSEYLKKDEEGKERITAPTVIFVNKGKIIGVYIGVINQDTEEVMTDEEKSSLYDNFLSLIDKMKIGNEPVETN